MEVLRSFTLIVAIRSGHSKWRKYLVPSIIAFFMALRVKGWESSKDIGSPAYQSARFAARLTLGLLQAYVLNPISFVTLPAIWPTRDHNQVLLRGGGDSASAALQFR